MNAREIIDAINATDDTAQLKLILNAARSRMLKLEHQTGTGDEKYRGDGAALGDDVAANPGRALNA